MTPLNIIVHHTATPRDTTTIQAVDAFHRDKDWGDGARIPQSSLGWYVAYHYFIEANGKVTQCADDSEVRWHAAAMNETSLGICMAGWFDAGHDDQPSPAQVTSLAKLLNDKSSRYLIRREQVNPHRKFANKSCYGYNLSDDWAANLLKPMIDLTKHQSHLAQQNPGNGMFGLIVGDQILEAQPSEVGQLVAVYLMRGAKGVVNIPNTDWVKIKHKPFIS